MTLVITVTGMFCGADGSYFHKQWDGRTSKAGGDELDGWCWHEFPAGMVATQEVPA